MKWASAVSDEPTLDRALDEVIDAVRTELGTLEPDLLLVFVTGRDHADYGRISDRIASEFTDSFLLGCSAGGVIGGGHEIEQRPGLSLTGAYLPGVQIAPFHLLNAAPPESDDAFDFWRQQLGLQHEEQPHFIVLPDPFTVDPQPILASLDHCYPDGVKIGGLASGGRFPGANALFLGNIVASAGLVGVALSGNIEANTVVAQGCRPIGVPMFVTGCSSNTIFSLDGKPPAEILARMFEQSDGRDRELFRQALFLGLVMREHQESYAQGDFLIRNLIGLEPQTGHLHIGADLHEGQVVQFHLRDAITSAEDLDILLSNYRAQPEFNEPAGALLFSCLGRGIYLYGKEDHDTDIFREKIGDTPMGGFFCNGEIGPVQGTTFIHGYTSAFVLFRPKDVH